jgi:two-component system probable response regulator PhcQ
MSMRQKSVLLVDDEEKTLKYFSKALEGRFKIHSASSVDEALKVLEAHRAEIGVVVADQRMPGRTGVEFLKIVKERFPSKVRILTTAYSEFASLVEAVNVGEIYRFVSKPWTFDELEDVLATAFELHRKQIEDASLLSQAIEELKAQILEDRIYDVGLVSARIGHYVHNALCPLTVLIEQLLERDGSSSPYSTEFLQSIRAHIYEVARTLKDLEQASVPPTAQEYEWVELEPIFEKTLAGSKLLRQEKGLQVEMASAGELPPIRGVPAQIEKLFRFMLAEEIVSLPAGSTVRVHFHVHEADGDVLGVRIEFEDDAPIPEGMAADSLLHPFNLRSSNPREFGIFLTSCYFIARHRGGSLQARVKEAGGVSFSFFLPSDPEEALAADSRVFLPSREKPADPA